jgi:hypothetical protein
MVNSHTHKIETAIATNPRISRVVRKKSFLSTRSSEFMSPLDPDLARALDKLMRASLDTWASLWFWFLVISTIAVAIGIIFEAPEVFQEVGIGRKTVARIRTFWYVRVRKLDLNGWERVCPELVARNGHHRRWVAKAGLVGWLLVAIGVAGEGIAEYFVNDSETNIRAYDEASLAETTREAGNAQVSATDAANAASRAIGSAQTAQSVSRKAGNVASEATASASNALSLADGAHKQAESAERLIEDERKTRLELQRSLTPRQFEFIQIGNETSFDDLKPFRGMRVILEYVPDGGECELAASAIIELVTKAGWTIDGTPTPNRNERPGVYVEWYMHFDHTDAAFAAEEQSREAAQELVSFLKASDWVAEGRGAGERMNNIPEGTVRVHVGYKPLPFFESSVNKELREADPYPYVDTDEIARIKKIKDRRERLEKEYVLQWKEGLRRFQRPSK